MAGLLDRESGSGGPKVRRPAISFVVEKDSSPVSHRNGRRDIKGMVLKRRCSPSTKRSRFGLSGNLRRRGSANRRRRSKSPLPGPRIQSADENAKRDREKEIEKKDTTVQFLFLPNSRRPVVDRGERERNWWSLKDY